MESRQTTRKPFTGPSWPITTGQCSGIGCLQGPTYPSQYDWWCTTPAALQGKVWGAVHLPQVWARRLALRNRGMVQPESRYRRSWAERPSPIFTESARPPLPCPRGARGRAPGPVSRGTGRRAAICPAHADTESLTQHGPAAGGAAGPNRPRGQCCATPCWLARGTEGGTPSPYPHRPGADQSTLGRRSTGASPR
jgi:hypothetical protein